MTNAYLVHDVPCRFAAPNADTTILRLHIIGCMELSAATPRPLPAGRERHYWGVASEIAEVCRTYCAACVTRCAFDDPCYRILEYVYLASKASDPVALPDIVGMVSTKLWPDPDPDVPRQH